MKNEQESADNLLARYLAGETDAAATAQAEAWIAASEENRAYFESLKKTWELAGNPDAFPFDTDAAWNKLSARMQEGGAASHPKRNYSWAIAAAVTLLVGISVYTFWPGKQAEQALRFAATDAVQNDTLPDGSVISLNKNSQLEYSTAFSDRREVSLKGEAFFDVHHDASHPFTIHTELMDVRVLGTSFNVRAYPNSDSVRVTVSTGRVRCIAGGDTVYITAGEFAVYRNGGKMRKGLEEDPNTLAYRSRIFRFSDTPLPVAIAKLNDVYGSHIVIRSERLNSCRLSADFKNESLDNILEVIETALPLTSKREGKEIILDGPGCQ